MASAPWDAVPEEDQLFVLVTGANSGVGLAIGQRLIDEFLPSRSLSSHLILIVTTRSLNKSKATIAALKRHLDAAADASTLRSRSGSSYRPEQTLQRVHILGVELDLCDLRSVFGAADRLVHGRISSPGGDVDPGQPTVVRIPRLDSVIFNAGTGGWTGLEWPQLIRHFFTRGLVDMTSWPTFKGATPGLVVDPLRSVRSKPLVTGPSVQPSSDTMMGEVFCANVFGHYLFAHRLMPLLHRSANSNLSPGRIIWESSLEPLWSSLSMNDFQALRRKDAYESTKRLTDVLALTADLPAVRPYSEPFLQSDAETETETETETGRRPRQDREQTFVRPKTYVVHPGILATTLFPLHPLLFPFYSLALLISRWLGSPWHPVTAYSGACAPVYVALRQQSELDHHQTERVKLGSSTSFWGHNAVKKTEVEGWGWEGKVEDAAALAGDGATGALRKMVGRKPGAVDLTSERLEEFEALGAECWQEMERLRGEWTARYRECVETSASDAGA